MEAGQELTLVVISCLLFGNHFLVQLVVLRHV